MPAEVQIAELAMNQAKTESGYAEMAAERHRALFQWRAPHQACATQQKTGIGVGLTSPCCLPQHRACIQGHLWHGGRIINHLH